MGDATNAGLMGENEPKSSFPLQHEWVFYYNEKPRRGVSQDDFEKSIVNMGAFSTIERFWQHFNNVKPDKLPVFSTLRLFKTGIKPCWEDPANYHGGKWVLNTDRNQTCEIWGKIVLAAVGNSLQCSDELCGLVLSLKPEKDTIQIWNRHADPAVYQGVTVELRKALGLSPSEEFIYQIHAGSMDFNTNAQQNKSSPTQKRRQSRESNGHPRKGGSPSGNGFHHPSTTPPMKRNNSTPSRAANGGQAPQPEKALPGNGKRQEVNEMKPNPMNAPTTRGKGEGEAPVDTDAGISRANRQALNKSWGDIESDSEESSDTDIWGSTDDKVDWGELAEEEEEVEETNNHRDAKNTHTPNTSRWSDEMELLDEDIDSGFQHTEEDGFICVSRRRKGGGEGLLERRSVSQDNLQRGQSLGPGHRPESSSFHKRAHSIEVRDGPTRMEKRGTRKGKSNNSHSKGNSPRYAGGSLRDSPLSDSVSPRGTTYYDVKHKQAHPLEQGEPNRLGRRASQSYDTSRRKASGSRPSSPAPVAAKPPPGLKAKAWSPVVSNPASWAQVTQGNRPGSPRNAPILGDPSGARANEAHPHSFSSTSTPAPQPSPVLLHPIAPTHSLEQPALSSLSTTTNNIEPPTLRITCTTEDEKQPATPKDPPADLSEANRPDSAPVVALHADPTEGLQEHTSHETLGRSVTASVLTLQPPPPENSTTTPSSAEAQGGTKDSSAPSTPVVTPRRKEKRKRSKRALKKKKGKGKSDLRTHWFLLLSLIVLSASVFCGIFLVHFIQNST